MINKENVVIVIPHLGANKEEEYALDECLISLKETAPNIKVLIAKNGESCSHKDFDVWVREQDQGTAVNATIATTDTEWIMVSNSDMIYPFGWWEELTFPMEGREEIMCISPKLIEPRDGAPTFEKQFFGGAGGDFNKAGWSEFARNYKKNEMPLRTGFNLPFLIKREVWNTVQGYDINYRPWGSNSDSDIEYKIRLAGVQPYQNTNCIVYHFSNTTPTFVPENQPYWSKNWDYFISKWGFPRTDNGIWEANFHLPTVEEGRIYKPSWEGKYL